MPNEMSKSAVLFVVICAAAAGLIFVVLQNPDQEKSPVVAAGETGFRDVAAAAGLDFQMGFLPGEQGATFKINLYDHGCGVAIGDSNGDGHDDIYFLNQLGPNALF
jgi:hypothetical protein